MSSTQAHRAALEAIDRILNRGGDADDVLCAVVSVLRERAGYAWVAIAFVEQDELVLGPAEGKRDAEPASLPVSYQGTHVAELQVAPEPLDGEEHAFLERVATLISAQCLVGWDTGGAVWEP